MNQYGKAAVDAVNLITGNSKLSPEDAWKIAIPKFTGSTSSQEKTCPKNAFLGLCEDGLIKGIPPGNYESEEPNKGYAVDAVKILKNNPSLSNDKTKLWAKITTINENGQLDVVLTLWNNNMII